MVSPIGARFAPASASVMAVPLAPKSHNATTPLAGRPGSACKAASAVVASDTNMGGTPFGDSAGTAQRAAQRTDDPRAPVGGDGDHDRGQRPPVVFPVLDGAGHRAQGLGDQRLAAVRRTVGGHQWHRIADPLDEPRNTRPASVRLGLVNSGFCEGTPTSAGRLSHSVRTARRDTGARPGRAATRLAVPIDNPSDSLTSDILLGAHERSILTITAVRRNPAS